MDREKFGRAHLKTNQDLRDFLDYHLFPSYKEFASKDTSVALSFLHRYVDILCEMMKRIWDEFEGHQDVCRQQAYIDEEMKRFIQGFGYRKFQSIPCNWIDNDADDGWGASLDELTETLRQATQELPMDKQIKKVEKDVKKGSKGKAMKDIKTLKKMDKKFDKKIDKAKKVMKKGC